MKLLVPNTPLHVVSIKNVGKEIVTITESTPQSSDLEAAGESLSSNYERNPKQLNQSRLLACRCAEVADEFRGENIVVLDLTKITPEFDFFVITTGKSRRQLHAIIEEADRMMADQGSKRLGIEGYASNNWILQDYGDVVLHVFDPEYREIYDLERLWGDAEKVDWKAILESQGES